jgi:carotenoid cleavage dioxygenase
MPLGEKSTPVSESIYPIHLTMAYIHEFVPSGPRSYEKGRKAGDQVKFPGTAAFAGFNEASRLEGDVFDLEFDGIIPKEIDGTFYRIQPDHRFPPTFEDDIQFNGDGSVTAIRIQNGHADFKQRYVQTDRFKHETAARKSLFGKYRNLYTDHETVKGVIRTASNTNIIFWRGTLLAMKEDGPPFAMDPVSLETIGRYDFEGQVLSPTFTAHPKFDPDTGEMVCYGYEAGGNGNDGSCDIVVYTINADGKKTEEAWYKAPFCGMIHDCGLTKNYLVLPMTPLKCSVDRLKKGGSHWAWDPNEDQLYGIVPRRGGKPDDIIWLRADNGSGPMHLYKRPVTDNCFSIPRSHCWLLRELRRAHRLRPHACQWVRLPSIIAAADSRLATSSSGGLPKTSPWGHIRSAISLNLPRCAGFSTPNLQRTHA